jgi:hypothetical protein
MSADKEESETKWHVDRRVPLATLIALIIQTSGMVWWASSLSSTVDRNSKDIEDFRVHGTPLIRSEISGLKERTSNFDRRLDRIEVGIDRLDRKMDAALEQGRQRK